MSEEIRVVSLFSGIGGFEEGLHNANIKHKVVFASEIDEHAKRSYMANFSGEYLNGDIKKIDERDIPSHELLLAGFPCQAFSIAGRQKGFEDIRGTLFFDVVRILQEKKPKYILLENVKNLISHDGSKTIRVILNMLNEIGYTVDFTIINSSESGVPQNRDRTYICGIYLGDSERFKIDKRNIKVNSLKQELNKTEFKGFNFFNKVVFSNKQIYIEDILEVEVENRYFLNSELVEKFIENAVIEEDIERQNRIVKLFDLPKSIHNDLERQRRVYSVKGISPKVLARAASTKIYVNVNGKNKIRKITPAENFYIQGFSREFVNNIIGIGMSVTQMYKQSGNAVSPPVIEGILRTLHKEYIDND